MLEYIMTRTTSLIAFALIIVFGCAPAAEQVKRRYFWPPLPDTPKIEFVAAYWSEADVLEKGRGKVLESIVGAEAVQGFNRPWGIVSDGEGKVYITDVNLRIVFIFDLKNHKVDTINNEESPIFKSPTGITLDSMGNIYVSDSSKNRILVFTKSKAPLLSIGNDINLDWPVGIAVNDNMKRLYVVNRKLHNIAVFDLEGKHLFTFGRRGAGDGEFNFPTDVALDSKGNIVVADSMNARVQILDPDGKFIRKFGQRGDRPDEFQIMKGVAVSRDDNIYVTDAKVDKIVIFNSNGDPLTAIGGSANVAETRLVNPGGFNLPQDIFIDKNDTIFVVDSMNKRFQIFQIINEDWLKKHPIEQ